jgi:hypothetical protein
VCEAKLPINSATDADMEMPYLKWVNLKVGVISVGKSLYYCGYSKWRNDLECSPHHAQAQNQTTLKRKSLKYSQ